MVAMRRPLVGERPWLMPYSISLRALDVEGLSQGKMLNLQHVIAKRRPLVRERAWKTLWTPSRARDVEGDSQG